MKLTDFPEYVAVDRYDAAIDEMADHLAAQAGVRSVYQIGSVSSPGISDVDLFVVLDPGSACHINMLRDLDAERRYLFCHGAYAISTAYVEGLQRYTFFHNYKLLRGVESLGEASVDAAIEASLKQQIALEYLVKLYVNMLIEGAYGIFRVRGFLLHIKAVLYDLEFLGISAGPVHDAVCQAIEWRSRWFESPPRRGEFLEWRLNFTETFNRFLGELLNEKTLYMPVDGEIRIAGNVMLEKSEHLWSRHSGRALPSVLGGLGRRYFNIQHRFNRFRIGLPFEHEGMPGPVEARFAFLGDLCDYNARMLPHFEVPSSSLRIIPAMSDAGQR